MNWVIIIVVFVGAISLISFLVIRNQKDKRKLIRQLNNESMDNERHPGTDEIKDKIY